MINFLKEALYALFLGSILAGAVYFLITKVDSDTKKLEQNIGEVYILDNDTLTIVDYSVFEDSYTLSNGVTINSKLINK